MIPATGKTHTREHGWGVHNNLVEASAKSHQSDGRCGKYSIIYIIYRKEWNTLIFAIHQQHCPMIHTDYALRWNTLQTQSLSTITWSCIWWQHRRWRKLRQPESLIPNLPIYFSTSKDCGGYKQLTLSYLSWFELLPYLKEMCLQVSIQCKSWTSHELRQEQCTNWWSMWIRCWLIYFKRFRNLSVVSM